MKCNESTDLFSPRWDGDLQPAALERHDEHLLNCEACREAYAEWKQAMGGLRSLPLAPLPADYAASIAATVWDDSAPMALVPPAGTRRRTAAALVPAWTSAAALVLGTLFGGLMTMGLRTKPEAPEPEIVTRVEEVRVEVPVEVRVEVPVEVPVEVVREVFTEVPVRVPVEVPVEVERIRLVDRSVPHPLQARFDQQLALVTGALASWQDALALARRNADERAKLERPRADFPMAQLLDPAPAPARSLAAPGPVAPVTIQREGDQVRIRTLGETQEVVPALIATLDHSDPAVVAAATEHLDSIRRRLTSSLDDAQSSTNPGAQRVANERNRQGGLRGLLQRRKERAPLPDSPKDRWRDWWQEQPLARTPARAY